MSARDELAALILDHAGVAYGRGDAHCLCGELLWTLKDGFTVGPLAMTPGRAVGEIAHANHLANVLAKHDAEVGERIAVAIEGLIDPRNSDAFNRGVELAVVTVLHPDHHLTERIDLMFQRRIARATTTTEVGV